MWIVIRFCMLLFALGSWTGAKERVVYVGGMSGYIPWAVLQAFQRETGIRVVYDSIDSMEALMIKLYAQYSRYDVMILSAYPYVYQGIQGNMLQEIPWSPAKLGTGPLGKSSIMYQKHAVPYLWGTTGILHRSSLKQPSWRHVFDEAYVKGSAHRVAWLDSAMDVFSAAALYLNMSPQPWKKHHIETIAAHLKRLRPYVHIASSDRLVEEIVRGHIHTALIWSHDAGLVRQRVEQFSYTVPKQGGVVWMDMLVIPKQAQNTQDALAFIQFFLRATTMARVIEFIPGYSIMGQARASMPLPQEGQKLRQEVLESLELERTMLRAWLGIKGGLKS